ncbi:MAG TPA: hypothetical protein VML55_25030 [Planctomycetaceae bacterium]|nr:hypothetical protein [Planctomycetaceae bacterium]
MKPDGTLELESSPGLPAGPVEVVVHSLSRFAPSDEDWWQYLQRVRSEVETEAGSFRTESEIEAEREDFRSGDERIENVLRRTNAESAGTRRR